MDLCNHANNETERALLEECYIHHQSRTTFRWSLIDTSRIPLTKQYYVFLYHCSFLNCRKISSSVTSVYLPAASGACFLLSATSPTNDSFCTYLVNSILTFHHYICWSLCGLLMHISTRLPQENKIMQGA
ncbi:hypothetical protein POM88_007148 [Heracleum sosnowskyi]|uniref:Uncharacterized protein n=1 Tax=Heracleum sosnowskyi TaxID=360622 RepID=A0AAD8J7L0_9APIA|nr:hypothetical protein POM88_007148 [Heracleum sosnowskyi]